MKHTKVAKGTLKDYPHPKPWNGKALKGVWWFTIKIDGVRMLRDDKGKPVARSGKYSLFNLDGIDKSIGDAEIYKDSLKVSQGLVRSSVNGKPIPKDCVYSLWPLDPRLDLGSFENPTEQFINRVLESQVGSGNEGLILRQGTRYLKVKPKDNADVLVTGIQPGTGKHEGRMGALLTDHGKVGTGFSDVEREEEWAIGDLIEAEYMEITEAGKMRHARFVRRRLDKTEESLPWVTEDTE